MMEFNGHTETVSKHVIEAAQEKKRCRQRDGIKEGDRLQWEAAKQGMDWIGNKSKNLVDHHRVKMWYKTSENWAEEYAHEGILIADYGNEAIFPWCLQVFVALTGTVCGVNSLR